MHFVYVSTASGTLLVLLNLLAKSDHNEISDCMRSAQLRLAWWALAAKHAHHAGDLIEA